MITKKALIGAISNKIKPVSTLEDNYGWKQSISLSSGDVPDLSGKKVGDKISIQIEGVIKSECEGEKFNIEINKVG